MSVDYGKSCLEEVAIYCFDTDLYGHDVVTGTALCQWPACILWQTVLQWHTLGAGFVHQEECRRRVVGRLGKHGADVASDIVVNHADVWSRGGEDHSDEGSGKEEEEEEEVLEHNAEAIGMAVIS